MTRRLVIVFLGGGLGAATRAGLLTSLPSGFIAVLIANLVGTFVLAYLLVLADEAGLLHVETRLFLTVGFLGGLTTFSTLAWQADGLISLGPGGSVIALAYVTGTVLGGIVMVQAGFATGRQSLLLIERGAEWVLARLTERGLRTVRGKDTEETAR